MSDYPSDDRLNGPIHCWFGLSYSNYLVLHRTPMQSMPVEWQQRMVTCLGELHSTFAGVDKPAMFWVQPARECSYSDLSAGDMHRLHITYDTEAEAYYDGDGNERDPDDRLLVPYGDDPVPDYGRGRTYIAPTGDPDA